jgi:hypothetical protein
MYTLDLVSEKSRRMIVTRTPFILPTKLEWLSMLVMIGIFGFFGQVLVISFHIVSCSSTAYHIALLDYGPCSRNRWQRCHGNLYAGTSWPPRFNVATPKGSLIDRLRHDSRTDIFQKYAFCPFCDWDANYLVQCTLCGGTLMHMNLSDCLAHAGTLVS